MTDVTNSATEFGRVGDRREEEPTLRDKLVSAGLWGMGLTYMVPMTASLTAAYTLLGADTMEPVSRWYLKNQLRLLKTKWRCEVHPAVDPGRQYIFAQNHINHFDYATMYRASGHFKQGLELETHFKYPFYGWFMKSRGTIPVSANREGRTESVLRGIREEVARGHSILAFPEGTRTLNGRVGPFRKGIFVVAQQLGLPIVPTAVTGMYDVMRKGSLLLRPNMDVTVYLDEPVETEGTTPEDIPRLMDTVRDRVAARVDAYMDERERTHGGRR